MVLKMLAQIIKNTNRFLEQIPRSERKKKGQFFTSIEIARFMAKMFDLTRIPEKVNILDPGTGTGILSAAVLERLEKETKIKAIHLTCYETDTKVLPVLKQNMEYIAAVLHKNFSYEIRKEDYILSQQNDFNKISFANPDSKKYDLIIGNPPYLRIRKANATAQAMPSVVHGSPNLYFLFTTMSLFNLREDAEMVYIIPRSWTSGAYFSAFRRYLLDNGKINHITYLDVPYNSVIKGTMLYVYLPVCKGDMQVLDAINTYKNTLPEEGLRMRTGIVVDFRQKEDLKKEPGEYDLPLFYSQHIKGGRVNHNPSGKEFDWITSKKKNLIQKNQNYVFCKRFTAKEERRRLQCGIYNPNDFKQYKFIATQNKINYIDRIDGLEMSLDTTYGVFALFNSTLFDMYYRILNGSTQVNSTEINSIPVPPIKLINKMGNQLRESKDLSTDNCDRIVMEMAYE